jgi:TPR repeat protein
MLASASLTKEADMLNILVLLLVAILSEGCAKTCYVKPGASVADFEQDKEDCATNASMAAGYGTFRPENQIANAIVYGPNLMDQCLRRRGWRKATQAEMEQIEKIKSEATKQEMKPATQTSTPEQTEAEYYEAKATQGDAVAQFSLGWLYARGQGVPQDYAQARQWYEKAAAQGDTSAQKYLASLYAHGQGVPQDYVMATFWPRRAADQGDAMAQVKLGMSYEDGLGVPQDYVEAHKWYTLSAANGDKQGAEFRDVLAKRMTPAQIAEAQKLAQEWKPKKL